MEAIQVAQSADPTVVMRGFHSMIRSQMMDDTKDEETREKLWGMNYLFGLSLDSQTINIPSNFLLPMFAERSVPTELKPSTLEVDKCKGVASLPSAPFVQQSLPSLHPAVETARDKDV